MIVPMLPAVLAPPPPFPMVVMQTQSSEFVAPGVQRATYRLQTSDGPLVIHVVAADLRETTLRFGTVLANDRMISSGETTSSMAHRTGAIAGVNGDYFDIGNTNQPLGIVVRDGALLRTPSKRVVLDVRRDRTVHFEPVSFSGSVKYGTVAIPLTGVNEWPPQGGASLLTADYGTIKPSPGVTIAELIAADTAHLATRIAGTYRIATIGDVAPPSALGPLLAFGPAARALAPPPAAGDIVTLEAATDPALDRLACAVGGGPLLLSAGLPADDQNEPAPEERERRFPVSGAALAIDSKLLLVSVDGRQPSLSIGVTRPQFAALLLAFGATDGMAFDSGGSATLVARVLGDATASVQSTPSDGFERRVADGFFIYSDAPAGPPTQLAVHPAQIVALPHAVVPITLARVDAAGHAFGAAHLSSGDVVRVGATPGPVVVRAGGVRATIPVEVVERLARLDVTADVRAAEPDALVRLNAHGFDIRGRAVELGDVVRWSADRGTFASPGRYRATERDATIVAFAGGIRTAYVLHVGSHAIAVPAFDRSHAATWHLATLPASAPAASLTFAGEPPELQLAYDFSASARTVAANASIALPGEPLAFAIDVLGDGSGVGLRATFVNRFGERRSLALARNVDWSGWQTKSLALPDDLNPPVRLIALSVTQPPGVAAVHAAGRVAFRNPSVTVAGSP